MRASTLQATGGPSGSQTPHPRLLHRGGALDTQRCRSSRGSTLRSGAACSAGIRWAPWQAGVTDRCLDTARPGRLALPLGQPLPAPVPAQALGPCLPGSQSPSLKPCSEVRTTGSPRSGRGSRRGAGAGRGLVCWPCCTQPSHRPRPVPEGPQLAARPSPRWPASRGWRAPSVFSGGPSQEGSQAGQGQKDPRAEFQDNLRYFCPERMRLRPLSPSAGVAPVGVRLRPPSPSHCLQPQPCGPLTDHRALSRGLCGHVGARPAPGCGFHGRECLRPAGSCGRLPWRSRRAG